MLVGADVFIGVSAPGILAPEWIAPWPLTRSRVFALANPDPEVGPASAAKYAAVVASGRSGLPQPDQQRAGFPGVFRGLLDARAHEVTVDMCQRARPTSRTSSATRSSTRASSCPSVFRPEVPGGRGRDRPTS